MSPVIANEASETDQTFVMQPLSLQCVNCGRQYPPTPQATVCPHCSGDSNRPGILDLIYDDQAYENRGLLDSALLHPDRAAGLWAYADLLPVESKGRKTTLGEGHTPLIEAPSLASFIGIESLWIKNETQNPTGSYKDRIAAMVTAKAVEAKAKRMVLVSSGNMATATAAYGSVAGMETIVIVSSSVSRERLLQIAAYGGYAVRVRGSSTDRLSLCLQAADKFGWYNANSPYNPYGPHGAKTTAYEIFLQGGQRGFDWIVSPVGFGCNIVGNWKGFEDLLRFHLIQRLPRLLAIQSEGSPSLVKAFEMGLKEAVPGPQDTIAGGLSQVVTLNSVLALEAIRKTQGKAVAVSDEELLNAIPLLAQKGGIYAEPSGVAALAGLIRLLKEGKISRKERVLLLISGSGLKDPLSTSLLKDLNFPEIDPTLGDLEENTSSLLL